MREEAGHIGVGVKFQIPSRDFKLVLLGALVLLTLIVLGDFAWFLSPLRLLLGLAYVLYVPGYCLVAAIFPDVDEIDIIERHGLSFGLSVVAVSILALLLDLSPWGIGLWTILFAEYTLIALGIATGLWRRSRLPISATYAPTLVWRPRPWWRSLPVFERRVYTVAAGLLLLVVVAVLWVFLVPAPAQRMTEFYMLGKAGLAQDYPRSAVTGEPLSVTLGVANRELEERSYRVEVWAFDSFKPERRALVARDGPITLSSGQTREWQISWGMPWAGADQQIELLLFEGDNPQPYRRLALWLNVTDPQAAP